MTAHDLIMMMGRALGAVKDGRYADLEQDAMRYWVLKEKVNIVDLDDVLDKEIDKILNEK